MPKLKLPDIDNVVAIDIHTHAEEPCGMHGDDGYDDFQAQMAEYFKSPNKHPPTVKETAAYYRSKNIAAVMIIISGVYHLLYLTFLAKKRTLPLSMLPAPKDALDIRDNILFMLGLKKERPKFDRYMYLEKFDYWAVFWGIIMMVGSGFIFWFPVQFAKILPTFVLTAAQIIHGEEATLAAIFLFVVHFYNVHLKPSIFPMNWAWLNGQTTLEYMKEEHPAEYDRKFGGHPDAQ